MTVTTIILLLLPIDATTQVKEGKSTTRVCTMAMTTEAHIIEDDHTPEVPRAHAEGRHEGSHPAGEPEPASLRASGSGWLSASQVWLIATSIVQNHNSIIFCARVSRGRCSLGILERVPCRISKSAECQANLRGGAWCGPLYRTR